MFRIYYIIVSYTYHNISIYNTFIIPIYTTCRLRKKLNEQTKQVKLLYII